MNKKQEADLAEWNSLSGELANLKAKELRLRKKVVASLFKDPKEGTNTLELAGDWKLKMKHTINRKLDEASLPAVWENLPEGSEDRLVKYKPSLVKKAYDVLSDEELEAFNEAIITSPGSPSLELVAPKGKD